MEEENKKLKALVVFTEEKVKELARRTKRISTELKALSETIIEVKHSNLDEVEKIDERVKSTMFNKEDDMLEKEIEDLINGKSINIEEIVDKFIDGLLEKDNKNE